MCRLELEESNCLGKTCSPAPLFEGWTEGFICVTYASSIHSGQKLYRRYSEFSEYPVGKVRCSRVVEKTPGTQQTPRARKPYMPGVRTP